MLHPGELATDVELVRHLIAQQHPQLSGPVERVDSTGTVKVHADLLRPNLLVRDGRLRAVLDFGGVGVGDPAADVIAAWSVLGSRGRPAFREALEVDDGTWERARGYALHQAVQIVPYYASTNPRFVELAQRTVREVLADRTAA